MNKMQNKVLKIDLRIFKNFIIKQCYKNKLFNENL